MNKRGFTLIELISCFVVLALLGTIGLISYKSVMEKSEETYYKTMEQNLLLSGNEYYNDHRGEKPINSYSKVSVSNLISNNYIEQLKDKSGNNCSRGDVFIYQQENGNYEYEVCLECGDYISEGTYCSGNIPGEISILSKLKSNNNDYNSLLGYSNVEWINSDSVMMTFTNTDNVDKYVIVNIDNNETLECNILNHENNSCSIEIDETGSYKVIAYSDDEIIGHEKTFNVKIDNNNPSFDIDMSNKNVIKDGTNKMDVPIVIKNIKDDSGIQSVEYRIGNTGDYTVLGNEKEYSFNENLESGVYQLEVVVTDLSGKKTRKTVDFVVSYLIDLQYSVTKIEQFEVVKGQKYSYLDTLPTDYEGKDATWYRQDDVSIEVDNNSIVNLDHKHTLILKTLNSVDTPNSSFCKSNLKYNGSVQTLTNNPGNGYTFNNNTAQEVGEYIVIATLDSGYIWNDGTTEDKTFTCKIENSGQVCYWESVEVKGCTTSITTVKPTSPKKGDIYISSCVKTSEYYTVTGGTMICVNSIGKSITKTVNSSQVHKSSSSEAAAYCQSLLNCPAGTTHSAIAGQCEPVYVPEYKYTKYTYICNKTAADLTKTLSENTYEYDETSHTPTVTIKDGDKTLIKDVDYEVIYIDNIDAGTAKIEITYIGDYADLGSEALEFTITPKKIDIPTTIYCKNDLKYNNETQTLTNSPHTGYTFSNNTGKNAGNYTVKATLSSSNYIWSDGVTNDKTFTCSVGKSTLTSDDFTVTEVSKIYDENTSNIKISTDVPGLTIVSGNSTSYGNTVISSTVVGTDYNLLPGSDTFGITTIYYKVTSDNYNDYFGSATIENTNAKVSLYRNGGTWTSGSITSDYYDVYTRKGASSLYSGLTNSIEVEIPSLTKTDYVLAGWYTEATGGSKILNSDGTFTETIVSGYKTASTWDLIENKNLYAHWIVPNYSVSSYYYETLASAYDACSTTCTIKVLRNVTDSSKFESGQGRTTIIDTNGKTITKTDSYISTRGSGNLTISGNGKITTNLSHVISNNGSYILTVQDGVIIENTNTSEGDGINNSTGTLTMTGGTVTGYIGIRNGDYGTTTISGGTVVGTVSYGIENTTANLNISGTADITGATSGTYNAGVGTLSITGGTITGGSQAAVFNYSASGTVNISGGTITSSSTNAVYNRTGGTINISGTTNITGATNGVQNGGTGTINISGGTINSNGTGTDNAAAMNYAGGSIIVTGGTLTGAKYGIYNRAAGIVTLGEDDGFVSTTIPEIVGSTYGFFGNATTGTLNFYDGRLYGTTDGKNSVAYTINTPTDYFYATVNETKNSVNYVKGYLSGQAPVVPLTGATVTLDPSIFYYDGLAKTPNVTVTLGGKTLTLNKDYTVTYKDNIDVGEGTVTITGIGNYTGTIDKHFSINPCSIVGATVVLSEDTFYHDNNPKTPTITVILDGKVLTLDKDYTVTYKDNTDVGEGTVTITGIGNYTGTIDEHFSINLYPIADATVVLSEDNFYYDSNPKTPTVMVTLDGKVLTLDKDYAVTYKDNVNVGEGTVTITGIGDYTGTIEKHLSISYCEYTVNFYTYDGETKYGSLIINGYQTKVLTTINALGGIAPISGGLFQGWAETANSTTVKYIDGENVNLTGTCPTNRIINLYAIWKNDEKNYSVTFDLNDYPSMTYNGSTYTSSTTISCSVPATYNNNSQATSCLIEAPVVTTSEYDVMKWENSSNPTVTAPTISYIGGYIPATSEIVTLYANGYYGCKNGTTLSNFITKVSSGDGFWADPWSSGRYIYRGLNPDNHIEFNGDSTNWRIMSIESDGTIGIVYTGKNISQKWNSANSGVWKDSTLYTYLNGTYYDSLSTDAKNMLVNHDWKTGYDSITDKTYTIADLQTVEESTNATGNVSSKVGLMRITDYLKASSYITETDNWKDNFYGGSSTRKYPQKTDNWLYDTTLTSSQGIWLLNKANGTNVRYIQSVGTFYINYLSTSYIVKPVVFLKADVLLRGTGTASNPYRTSTSCTSVQTSPATCNVTTSTTYEESKTLSISVTNNGVTVNEYSWDGINWVSSNSKSGIQLVGSYSGFIKDSNGDTNSCTPVNIVSRQEYQHETCIESRGCSGYTCSQYEYDFQLCDTNCYRSSLPSYSTSQLCRGQNHYWNSCTNSCYNYLASASYYSYNSLQSGDSNFTQGLSWCGCKTYDTSDQTWYTESKGISTTSKVKDAATRTTYAKAS